MSQNFNEFNYMSNDDFFEMDSPQNDESIESENDFAINILSDKLFYNNPIKIFENQSNLIKFLTCREIKMSDSYLVLMEPSHSQKKWPAP